MPFKRKFNVATRGSLLARTQTEQTVVTIRNSNLDKEFEIVQFTTLGDKVTEKPLVNFGGTGVFVKELENALIDNKADFAVHSLKDVPSYITNGLILACFPKREMVNDLFLTKNNSSIFEIAQNFKCGTGSPRRIIQIMKIRPDAKFADLRGNIDTRMRKLEEGQYDAIILAAAGMNRLGKSFSKNNILSVENLLPAIGQGAIAIECRIDDKETIEAIKKINHYETEIAVKTERVFMKEVEGGCKFPLAAYAIVIQNKVELDILAGQLSTGQFIRMKKETTIEKAFDMAKQMANELLEDCHKRNIKLFDLNE
ncbi:MAG: hydroxymethylbilane synthase [Bacteroidetes bacterium GWA2_32_17]|nr:MAG: hydroxymethylbilane synthase [Bacteroidetes bacterium GWA2_32_17]